MKYVQEMYPEQAKDSKALVLYSGGLDSTVLLREAEAYFKEVVALSMSYGQKHIKELECAEANCTELGIEMLELDLKPIFGLNPDSSALIEGSNKELKHTDYGDQVAELKDNECVSAYVPFRNGLFLSTAASIALQLGCTYILYGAHADDAAGNAYPDCTVEFAGTMADAIYLGTKGQVHLLAPFIYSNKAEIVARGKDVNTDFEKTWSCYEGKEVPCGTCGTCRDRKAALEANGIYNVL